MMNYIWPIALVVFSNVIYQISAKSVPGSINPLASLTVTYLVGALFSFVLYYVLNRNGNILAEYGKLNWAPFFLGLSVVGLEVGYICAYKAGWPISFAQIVQASFLAIILIFIGSIFYKETLTWNKIVGILVCLTGLGLINYK